MRRNTRLAVVTLALLGCLTGFGQAPAAQAPPEPPALIQSLRIFQELLRE